MPILSKKMSIGKFLSAVIGGKEAGLVIAKNKAELAGFSKIMDDFGFKRSKSAADLFGFGKTYFSVGEKLAKDVYDFVVQYPTGQIEIFDKKIMRARTATPDYKNSAVVLVVEKNNLNKFRKDGFDLLSVSGPSYRSQ